jgi:hypothetical protein
MKKLFAVLTVAMTALALSGCGMFEKKADPNFGLQLQAYKEAVAAKQSTEKAKADRKPVQVLTIKGQGDKPIIMSGISEITVNLPTELFEKGGSAPAEQVTMPSLPVEQPNFLERTADKVFDRLHRVDPGSRADLCAGERPESGDEADRVDQPDVDEHPHALSADRHDDHDDEHQPLEQLRWQRGRQRRRQPWQHVDLDLGQLRPELGRQPRQHRQLG